MNCANHPRITVTAFLCGLLLLLHASVMTAVATAQQRQPVGAGSYPNFSYYSAFLSLREGEHKLALEAFQETARSGLRTVDGPWIDAVCYRVMLGEVYLRRGEIQLAIDQYNAALNVMFTHQDWLARVQFPSNIRPFNGRIAPPILWGANLPATKYADVPDKFQILLGNLNNQDAIQNGGVVVPRELHSVNVHEIIRCSCLAMRRRYELLGPVAQHDPLTTKMLAAFQAAKGPPNHWTLSWMNAQRGWSLAMAGKNAEATKAFGAAVTLGGRYSHPLTPTALMGLGYMAREAGQPAEAFNYFIGASKAAAVFEEIETVEDAFVAASDVHLAGAPDKPLADLSIAVSWATRKRLPHLTATVGILSAENMTALRQSGPSSKLLARSTASVGRRATLAATLAARGEFVAAQNHYQQGKLVAAETSFQAAIQRQRVVSPWLNQIRTTSRLYRGRSRELTTRSVSALFDTLLREPTAADWSFRTLDTLAFVVSPSRNAHEDWFDVAMERDDSRKALEIGEVMRRRRFYSQLPLGGRVLSLRWCLEAPEEVLGETAKAARLDLLARYPSYKALSDKSRALQADLEKLPIDVSDEQAEEQKGIAKELDVVSSQQEAILGEIALRREACPFVFPPQATVKELQEGLQPKQLALIYVATAKEIHAFMLSREDYVHWELPKASQVRREAMLVLKQWGLTSDNGPVTTEVLRSTEWQEEGAKLLRSVIARGQHGFWNKFDELVIVPDGLMWYVPFEGLPIENENNATRAEAASEAGKKIKGKVAKVADPTDWQPLISQIRVRYVPTAGLINAKRIPAARDARTAVVAGKLFPRDDETIAKSQLETLQQVTDGAVELPARLAGDSGLLRCSWGGLVVLDDITDLKEGPLDWSPARVDEGRPGGLLRRWLVLPWGGPSQVILPGFHTPAESGMKSSGDIGEEMFATSMALMATGTRTVVLSRWRTGGLSSYDIVREFLQEDPEVDPSAAWQRSLLLMRENEIDPEWEPRVNSVRDKEPLSGDHPFFWSGYMLIGG